MARGQQAGIAAATSELPAGSNRNHLNQIVNCDSCGVMNRPARNPPIAREKLAQFGALGWLLLLGGLAFAGPYGVLAWGESLSLLDKREAQIASLEDENERLENLVVLLDPEEVDPDLSTELLRRDLNVAHPDEYIVDLSQK
jgi:cell division protein FtsB